MNPHLRRLRHRQFKGVTRGRMGHLSATLTATATVLSGTAALSAFTALDGLTDFTAAVTDIVTSASHGLASGDGPIQLYTTDTLPAGLDVSTDYYVNVIDTDTFTLHLTAADGLSGDNPVDITDTGTGTHSFIPVDEMSMLTSASHGLENAHGPVRLTTTDTLPTGLAADTPYWVHVLDANTISLHRNRAEAVYGTNPIAVTTVGAGTNSLALGETVDDLLTYMKEGMTLHELTILSDVDNVTDHI